MAVVVNIPAALQKLTRQQSEVHAEGGTVQAVLADLERCFPGMQAQLCDAQGAIRKFINLYVNDEDIRFLDGTQTTVNDGDELAIIPAVAGGSGGIEPQDRKARGVGSTWRKRRYQPRSPMAIPGQAPGRLRLARSGVRVVYRGV